MTILTAQVAKVHIGLIEINGLMDKEGNYYVAIPQLNSLISFSTSNNTVSRDLKRLLGESFQPSKAKTDLYPQLINIIRLQDLEKVLLLCAIEGNKKAQEISLSLIGLSLHQLFSDAFRVKFDEEDRQNWLIKRQITKQTFWWLTDEIKYWLENRAVPSTNPQAHYIMAFKAMSLGLFGKAPKTIKEELGIAKGELNRDHFGLESLGRIEAIQRLAKPFINDGQRPKEAVELAVTTFKYPVIDYRQ